MREEMNGPDGLGASWKNIKERLSFKGLGCCGSTWSPSGMVDDEEEEEAPIMIQEDPVAERARSSVTTNVAAMVGIPARGSGNLAASSGTSLAMALAAERNLRDANVGPGMNAGGGGQVKTLMRLIAETDGVDWRKTNRGVGDRDRNRDGGRGNDWLCCVCMERSKGAAFIPCGHAYCRVCSRDLWINRGSCPICNRTILQILDIF